MILLSQQGWTAATIAELFFQVTRRAVSATFIQLMGYVLAGYPTAPVVVLVLDNVLIHRSKLVQAWLRAGQSFRQAA